MKSIIVGGGFFGLYIAEFLAKSGHKVTIFEKEKSAMTRASLVNQARVHNGYHYPRSILTALRSRVSFPIFNEEFSDCIVDDFDKYYMVAGVLGKVTAKQFQTFCNRIGADCEIAPHSIKKLVNSNLVEEVFKTTEYAFDSVKLKNKMLNRLDKLGVEVHFNSQVISVDEATNSKLKAIVNNNGNIEEYQSEQVFNCTYSMINTLLINSKLDIIPLKHEITEMCLVEPPEEFKNTGLTVMCGPFFSMMPFPSKGLHSFSHVRYTPHCEWHEENNGFRPSHDIFDSIKKESAWKKMVYDSSRYIPMLKECKYKESIWEVKTLLPRSESDDSRPILFKKNFGLKGLHCIMGGKIDNVYDAISVIRENGLV